MMYGELYQYFIQHKRLNLPGIGLFLLERKPAQGDFPNRIIIAPSWSVVMQQTNDKPGNQFFHWLAKALGIPDRDAIANFNAFSSELQSQLSEGKKIIWEGMGVLTKGLAGEVRFEPAWKDQVFEAPVDAVKVIRENAQHAVRVGEDEKTSVQMIEYLNQPAARRNYWWAWALALGLLSIMFIGWHFSERGVSTAATGSEAQVQKGETTSAAHILQ
jgi:hypothetical protein